jgi:hypothetical protein
MNNILVVIPVHTVDEDVKNMLPRALSTVPSGFDVRISCAFGLKDELEKIVGDKKVEFIENVEGGNNNFQTLVNRAIDGYKWFSILEFDDIYSPIWKNNVLSYIEHKPDTSVMMCMEDLVDEKKEFVGFGNDAPWASSFSDEIGYIDNECLKSYFDFYMTGSLFNVDDWKSIGGLKESMKLTFWYEFLLRATNFGKKVFVMPKVGYIHMIGRKNSLVDICKDTLSDEEGQWWFDTARHEYFYKEDRKKEFQKEEE